MNRNIQVGQKSVVPIINGHKIHKHKYLIDLYFFYSMFKCLKAFELYSAYYMGNFPRVVGVLYPLGLGYIDGVL